RPGVSVSARPGYLAPSAETRAAEAAKAAAAAVPATVADELARLSRLRTDTELLTYGVRSPGGLDVVVELSSQEMARGRWEAGAPGRRHGPGVRRRRPPCAVWSRGRRVGGPPCRSPPVTPARGR